MNLIRKSPVASERVKALAERAIDDASALKADEMQELAKAIVKHNAMSETPIIVRSDSDRLDDFSHLRELKS